MCLTNNIFRLSRIIFLICVAVLFIVLDSCKRVDLELAVKVETLSADEVGHTFSIVKGKIIDMGDDGIGQHGFCYSVSEDPTLFDEVTQLGTRTTIGEFSDTLKELLSSTTYYYRAYAQTTNEIYYDNQKSFTTLTATSPVVIIESIGDLSNDSVRILGNVTDDGGAVVTERGVCWSLSQNPTIDLDHTIDGSGKGSFNSIITGLDLDTIYYIRAYATSTVTTSYSNQHDFITPPGMVAIITSSISNITENAALGGGNITDDGGAAVTARGVCWGTSPSPNIGDDHTTDGSGIGSFTSSIVSLSSNTTYYVRAFATNNIGIFYGNEVSFTTSSQSSMLPIVASAAVTGITENSAVSGGDITNDGGATVTARGVCWSTSQNPTLSDSFTNDGNGTGIYSSSLANLNCKTVYYVRAYATNVNGTAYGEQLSFTTGDCPNGLPIVTTTSVSSVKETSAESGGNISDDGGSPITARGVCWSTSSNPTLSDSHTVDGSGMGDFTSSISDISCTTSYYVRAYATNSAGTAYGEETSFTTSDCSANLATVPTTPVTNITETSAQSGGYVTVDGGSPVTARGICWSTVSNPTIGDNITNDGSGIGIFTSSLTGLSPSMTYYVRAYAINSAGTSYGDEVSFVTWSGSVTDFDGNMYQSVVIGDQTWMAENLKVTHYFNGFPIPLVENDDDWVALGDTDKGYCYYNNDVENGKTYGALYTWAAAMNGEEGSTANPSGVQGVCPAGWHLPSDEEWKQLEMYLGMSQEEADKTGNRGTDEGGKMKEFGTTHWISPNVGATNESGFTALPGGMRHVNYGVFILVGHDADFWTSTQSSGYTFWFRKLGKTLSVVTRDVISGDYGYSVRCVED